MEGWVDLGYREIYRLTLKLQFRGRIWGNWDKSKIEDQRLVAPYWSTIAPKNIPILSRDKKRYFFSFCWHTLTHRQTNTQAESMTEINNTAWVKNILLIFVTFLPNGWEFLVHILHAYQTFLSTLDYKFLFCFLQLWRSYAILSATTIFMLKMSTIGWNARWVIALNMS